jgi:hypothetical protein
LSPVGPAFRSPQQSKPIPDPELVTAVVVHLSKHPDKPLTIRGVAECFAVPTPRAAEVLRAYPGLLRVCGDNGGLKSLVADQRLVCYQYNMGECASPLDCERLHVCCGWLFHGKCRYVSYFVFVVCKGRLVQN